MADYMERCDCAGCRQVREIVKEVHQNRSMALLTVDGQKTSITLLGWECPVCGRGNSPYLSCCPCWKKNSSNATSPKSSEEENDIWKGWKKIGETDEGNIILVLDGEKESEK